MIGSVIDKYQVLQKLGEGATATVYRGRHLTIGKDVAIKVLHPHLSASSRYRERFNREARAVGRLSHQNIVSILDYSGSTAQECYIVTELVDGVTLQALLQDRGRLPSEIAAMAAADLASALAFAHLEGVIHRDIKPENVMIRRDGRLKLMDFGVARVIDESSITLDGSLLGSPAYMSPQQALEEKLDGRSDIFSLGTLLFHTLTGHLPFSGSNASVILRNIIEANRPEVLELAPGVSPKLAGVVDRLLQPRPGDRYATATEAHDALVACLAEVQLPIDHPTINLRAYLLDPAACEAALDTHLRTVLLSVGKARLAGGDTLGALQLFNRLLAIDEDNAEVIALIQSLHQAPARPRIRGLVGLIVVTLLALGSAGAWWTWGRSADAPPRKDATPLVSPAIPADPPIPSPLLPPPNPVLTAPLPSPPIAALSMDPSPRPSPSTLGTSARIASPATAGPPSAPPLAAEPAEPAEVVLTFSEFIAAIDVAIDGKAIGTRTGGKTDTWVGTDKRPIRLPPGRHTITLSNRYFHDFEEVVVLGEGERRILAVSMKKRKVTLIVKPGIPDACTMTIDGVPYREVANSRLVHLVDPSPSMPVVFECPSPIGTLRSVVGPTEPGLEKLIPAGPIPGGAEP